MCSFIAACFSSCAPQPQVMRLGSLPLPPVTARGKRARAKLPFSSYSYIYMRLVQSTATSHAAEQTRQLHFRQLAVVHHRSAPRQRAGSVAVGGGAPAVSLRPAIKAELWRIGQRILFRSSLSHRTRLLVQPQTLPSGSPPTALPVPQNVWQEEGEGACISGSRRQQARPPPCCTSGLPLPVLPAPAPNCTLDSLSVCCIDACSSEQPKPCCSGKAAAAADAKQQGGAAAAAAASSQQNEEAAISSFMFGG